MTTKIGPRYCRKVITPTTKALKAARILKGFSREEAGRLCGWSAKAFEQIENGRSGVSDDRLLKILRALGIGKREFELLKANPDEAISKAKVSSDKAVAIARKPRRSCFRIITKEVRVLRVLRIRKGLSQDEASVRCGYTRAIFGQIENGRINLPPARLKHMVTSLGFTMNDFDTLMEANVLRDEIIAQCGAYLQKLTDEKLESAQLVIRSLVK